MRKDRFLFLKKIVENSGYGYLELTISPVTGVAWLAMATSRNPGKAGTVVRIVRERDEVAPDRFVGH